MSEGLARLAARLSARRGALLTVVALLVALAGVGLTRFEVREDVTHLLAGLDVPGQAEAVEALTRFGAFDVLLVDVAREDGEDPAGDAGAYAAALEATGAFDRVLFELDPAAMRATFEILFARRFHLLPPPEDVDPGLRAAARDLMTPMSMMLEGGVALDPLDHRSRLLARLEGLAPALDLDTDRGRLMSRDGAHALIVLEPKARALDVEAAEAVLEVIRSAAPAEVRAQVFGPHVFATSAARAIRRDVHVTVAGSLLGVFLLFGLALGRVRYVFAVNLPVVIGGLWSLGLIGALLDGLHGITLGFGAVMLGIGIDYGVHLLVHYRAHRAAHPDEAPDAAMQATLRAVGPSVGMGALTTLAAFVVLLLSGTRALSDMVLFCGLGITFAFAFSLLVLPQLPGLFGGAVRPRDHARATGGLRARRWTLGAIAGLTLVAGIGASWTTFDGDIRNLDYQPPEVRAVEREIFERYAPPVHPTLVVVKGEDTERALRRAERAVELLEQGQRAGLVVGVSSVARLLPSMQTQRRNLAAHDAALEARVRAAAPQHGLRPEFFGPFFDALAEARAGRPAALAPHDLAGTAFETLVDKGVHEGPGGSTVSIVAHTGRAGQGSKALAPQLADGLRALGATVVSGASLAARAVVAVKDAVLRLAGLSLLAVGWLLLAYYRRPGRALLAILPAGLGLLLAAGVMGGVGVSFNIVSVGAFALVSGVGVDYGIFVTDALCSPRPEAWPATARSVRLAAATTLLGFGALLLADNPVMWSLGFAVTIGVIASFGIAAWGLPALYALGLGRDEPALRPGPLLLLGGLAAIAVTVLVTWAAGARTTNGAEVAVTLALDGLAIAWILRRARREEAPRA